MANWHDTGRRAHLLRTLQAIGFVMGSWAAPVAAQAVGGLDLDWQAPPNCPSQAFVRERVRALVGSSASSQRSLKASALVAATSGGFELKLSIRSPGLTGERTIRSDTCKDLAGAAAVAIALLIAQSEPHAPGADEPTSSAKPPGSLDGAAVGNDQTPAPPPPAATSPGKADAAPPLQPTSSDPETPRPAADAPARAWRWLLLLPGAALDLGPLSGLSGGGTGAVGLRSKHWQAFVAGSWLWPRTLRPPEFPGYGAKVWRGSAEAWACRPYRSGQLELSPCVLLGAEYLRVRGSGYGVTPQAAATAWASIGAGLLGRYYLNDWLAVTLGVGGKVAAVRPQIVVEGLGTLERASAAALTIRLGPEWIF